MKRKSGYYWVKLKGMENEWQIWRYYAESDDWMDTGETFSFKDNDFEEIDETQITRQ